MATEVLFNPRIQSVTFDRKPGTKRTLTLAATHPAPLVIAARMDAARAETYTLWDVAVNPAPWNDWDYALIEVDPYNERTALKNAEVLLTPSAGNATLLVCSSLFPTLVQRDIDDAHGAPANTVSQITAENPDGSDDVDILLHLFKTT